MSQMTSGSAPLSSEDDERVLTVIAHLSPLIASFLSAGWLSLVGPVAVWLIWRNQSPLVRTAAATSFNFNITIWVAQVIGWFMIASLVLLPFAVVLFVVPTLLQVIFSIWGAIRAGRGKPFKYPFQVPILRA